MQLYTAFMHGLHCSAPYGKADPGVQTGLLTAQTPQGRRFQSLHQVKNHKLLRCLLMAKKYGICSKERWLLIPAVTTCPVMKLRTAVVISLSSLFCHECVCV